MDHGVALISLSLALSWTPAYIVRPLMKGGAGALWGVLFCCAVFAGIQCTNRDRQAELTWVALLHTKMFWSPIHLLTGANIG